MPRKLKTGRIPSDGWEGIYPRFPTYEAQRAYKRKKKIQNVRLRAHLERRWKAQPLEPVTPEVAETNFVWRDCSILPIKSIPAIPTDESIGWCWGFAFGQWLRKIF